MKLRRKTFSIDNLDIPTIVVEDEQGVAHYAINEFGLTWIVDDYKGLMHYEMMQLTAMRDEGNFTKVLGSMWVLV